MADNENQAYDTIFISATDPDLPSWFSNDFRKYVNFREMGRGGNGVLLACYDNNLGRTVAIKRLADDVVGDKRERRRLLREARVTAQLQHPNTVPVYEIGKDNQGRLYFAMKRIEGENLFQILMRIARNDEATVKAFSLDRMLGIVVQASHALNYAHNHGVIHRDVKPENIMIGRYGETMLMDWGVAKVWGMAHESVDEDEGPGSPVFERLTVTGKRPGTPLYMSPEQVLGNKNIDERSDIFSMGVVLYEMLALREPFRGHNVHETFDNIIHETPQPPSEVGAHFDVPKRLDEICRKAMEKDPKDRYQSIQLMIDDIRDVRNQALTNR